MNKSRLSAGDLVAAVGSIRRVLLLAGGFSFFINLLTLVPAIYMMQIYDRVLASRSDITLLMLTLITLFLYALLGITEWLRSQLLVRASVILDEKLKNRVFNAIFEASLRKSGQVPTQALGDLANIRQFLTGNGLFAFFDAPWALLFLAVIFLLHPLLGAVSVVGMILLLALTYLTERATQGLLAESNNNAMQAGQFANNHLRNAEVVEAMGMLAALRQRWQDKHRLSIALQQMASDRAGLINGATRFVRISQQSLILGAGALLAIEGKLSPGSMIAASILMGRAMSPVELIIGSWKHFVSARSAFDRLQSLLHTFPEREEGMPLPAPTGRLTIEQVTVVAPQSKAPILKGIQLLLKPGEITGVIGPSASGKSTLARVMVGVWTPDAGTVRLDEADLRQANRKDIGPYIGYLPQDVELFEGTIAENIARFADVDPEAVVAAARRAGVHEMILRLPNGYDTQIGNDGNLLSGGQRQRIALARAVYGSPRLLVLDEPNSNLDDVGEAALTRAVVDLKNSGCTVVIISHRSSILGVADNLVVLREGAIQLAGRRDEVLAAMKQAAAMAANANRKPPAVQEGVLA